jgi:DNA polymerase III beta subunit
MITLSKKELVSALSKCSKVLPKKPSLEVLTGVNIVCKDGVCKFVATDLENEITIKLNSATFDNDNSFVLMDIASLSKAIKLFGDVITFEQVDNSVVVSSGSKSIKVKCLDSKDFPEYNLLGEFKVNYQFKVNGKELENLCAKVAYAVSKENARPALTTVCFRKNYITATNGFIISKVDNNFFECKKDLLFPDKAVKLFELIGDGNLYIGVYQSSDLRYCLEDENISLKGILLSGNFPDVDQIIPTHRDNYTKLTVNRLEFIDALDSMIKIKCRCVKLSGNKIIAQKLESVKDMELPDYEIEIANLNVEQAFAFNPKFVYDALKNQFTSDEVLFEVNKPNQPFVITEIGDSEKDGLFVCMPIHLG